MRLKSLKMAGFKSFANPTTFSFKHDITAIVGPNGCGKSNVIDAIRWVLGESSAKQLRGGAMSDVIFAGTDGRAAKSVASVELTFEHTQDEHTGIRHALNLYHELSLRRQVTQDGKSDYFINGTRVRRRDVVDVFLGTGLGARSYAVIEQGMIGKIIDADGVKLRAFIEEAAGVSRYQARKEETQKQLVQAMDNLARLNDLYAELSKNQKTLERQAKSAQIYESLQARLNDTQSQLLTARLYEAHSHQQRAKASQEQIHQDIQALTALMAQSKQRHERLSEQVGELLWQKDEAQSALNQLTLSTKDAEHAHQSATQKLDDLQHAMDELTTKHASDTADKSTQMALIEEHEHKLIAQKQALLDITALLKAQQQDKQTAQTALQQMRERLNDLYADKQALDSRMAVVQANHQSHQKTHARLQQKMQNMALPSDIIDEQRIEQLAQTLSRLDDQMDEKNHELSQKNDELASTASTLQALTDKLTTLEKQHAAHQGEYNTLHALVHKPTQSARSAPNPQSTLTRLSEALVLTALGERYADKLDVLFGLFWQDFVGECADLANLAHSLWFVCDRAPTQALAQNSARHPAIVSVQDLIKAPCLQVFSSLFVVDDTHAAWADVTWQTTAPAVLFDELSLPQSALLLLPDDRLLTVSGCFVLGADVSDVLQVKAEQTARLAALEAVLIDMEDNMANLAQHIKQVKAQYDDLQGGVADLTGQIKTLNFEYQRAKDDHQTLTAAKEKQRIHLDNYEQQYSETKRDYELICDEMLQMQDEEQQLAEELSALLVRLAEDEHSHKQHKGRIQEVEERLTEAQKQQYIVQHDIQKSEQTLATARALIERIDASDVHYAQKMQLLHDNYEALTKSTPALLQALKQAQSATHEQTRALELLDNQLSVLYHEQKQLQSAQTDNQTKLDCAHESMAALRADMAVATARVNDVAQALQAMNESFNLTSVLADFMHDNFNPATVGDVESLAREHQELSAQISKIGAVNLAAKSELDELNARLAPMMTQIEDVQSSIDKLNHAISQIDGKTKTLFLASLEAVNAELNRLFVRVFGGGQASLQLMDDDTLAKADKWQAGLVLMAQPKGKKNSRLAVLSGGEKTLTALSLVFAIFKQNPAPFCVLDEVDAPLDDANVARFSDLISELSKNVQFIFISHNKLAMQIAHELKGVTMPTAGISALVSVDLDEAARMVEAV